MSYLAQLHGEFTLKPDAELAALQAINTWSQQRVPRFGHACPSWNTLTEALATILDTEVRTNERTYEVPPSKMRYDGSQMYALDAIARHVEDGGTLEFDGEDDLAWRFTFHGGELHESQARWLGDPGDPSSFGVVFSDDRTSVRLVAGTEKIAEWNKAAFMQNPLLGLHLAEVISRGYEDGPTAAQAMLSEHPL